MSDLIKRSVSGVTVRPCISRDHDFVRGQSIKQSKNKESRCKVLRKERYCFKMGLNCYQDLLSQGSFARTFTTACGRTSTAFRHCGRGRMISRCSSNISLTRLLRH